MKSVLLLIVLFYSLQALAEPDFVHCYDFGCKSRQEINYQPRHWDELRTIFAGKQFDSSQEKQAIRKAIALMERISGELVGTSLDKGGNYPGYDIEKQQDCIDESTNTYQYLKSLENLDLLKWHRVAPKKRRIVWFATHWTAVIADNQTDQLFAVDSWYRDNGEPPYIQKLEDWEDKEDFPFEYNPD